MKISVVIPTYTITKELEEMAADCASYFVSDWENVGEVIICEDGGFISPMLIKAADTYIYSASNLGFTKNVNQGIKAARGEYIFIVNSDIQDIRGRLNDLCIPGKVTSPRTVNQDVPLLAGHFFVVPRTVFDKRGLLNEAMKIYCSDAEFESRVKDIFQQVDTVSCYHHINQTLKAANLLDGKQLEKDRKAYENILKL